MHIAQAQEFSWGMMVARWDCEKKRHWRSRREAKTAAKRIRVDDRRHIRPGDPVTLCTVYKCDVCGGYLIGHDRVGKWGDNDARQI